MPKKVKPRMMKDTIEEYVTRSQLDSTEAWREENRVQVKIKEDPKNEEGILKIWVTAETDYLIGQLKNKILSAPRSTSQGS